MILIHYSNNSPFLRAIDIDTLQLFLSSSGRKNFMKPFDWLSFIRHLFIRHFLSPMMGHRIAIGIDPYFIPKAGNKTPGVDWFWSGCAGAIKHGMEYPDSLTGRYLRTSEWIGIKFVLSLY